MTQEQINAALVEHARAGKRVVRLKGGDPFVFGRGGEELEALADAGLKATVVPGVTSAIGGVAAAGIPVTHRGVAASFAVVTGHEDPAKPAAQVRWAELATAADTLVVLMGVGRLEGVARALIEGGRPPSTPSALIVEATTPRQRVVEAPLAGDRGCGARRRGAASGAARRRRGRRAARAPRAGVAPPARGLARARHAHAAAGLEPRRGAAGGGRRARAAARDRDRPPRRPGGRARRHRGVARGRPTTGSPSPPATPSRPGSTSCARPAGMRALFGPRGAGARIAAVGAATARELEARGLSADLLPPRASGGGVAGALLECGVEGARVLVPTRRARRPGAGRAPARGGRLGGRGHALPRRPARRSAARRCLRRCARARSRR